MQYRLTVDNGSSVDITTYTTKEAADAAADIASHDESLDQGEGVLIMIEASKP